MNNHPTNLTAARLDLKDRLARIARRTSTWNPDEIELMHRCLDLFREEAKRARREYVARGDA